MLVISFLVILFMAVVGVVLFRSKSTQKNAKNIFALIGIVVIVLILLMFFGLFYALSKSGR